jgi:hypothetical protein
MARRTNGPLKTMVLLALLGAAGYLTYDILVVKKVLAGGAPAPTVSDGQRQRIREALLARLDKNPCFLELGPMVYRAREDRWRIDIQVSDGCIEEAKEVCRIAAETVRDDFRVDVSVWAFDGGGREIARFVP